MLTLDLIENIQLSPKPLAQRVFASLVVGPNYLCPWTRTKVIIEGRENLIFDRPVIFAMNHTDRFNYFPFQYTLWKDYCRFTAAWVKGKYYNTKMVQQFMVATNNIPVPSRGYIVSADALRVLEHPPAEQTYRILREAVDSGNTDIELIETKAREDGVQDEIAKILKTPRDILGLDFNPSTQNYVESIQSLFRLMMERFISLNHEAFALGLQVIVFPEGTRSIRLQKGHNGLAQMALRLGATIIPIGCNNSDLIYPGDDPFSRGGTVVYRIGSPLKPEEELAPYAIDEPYIPFTQEAESRYADQFKGLTEMVMGRIEELLDERHRPLEGAKGCVEGVQRFL